MATKSKNIKYSYGAKVLAFFLAMALCVSAGVLLASDVDLIMQYSSDDFTSMFTKTEFNYTDNLMFETTLENHTNTLSKLVKPDDFKEYINGDYCEKEEELQIAEKYYDSCINAYNENSANYADYGLESSEEYTTAVGCNVDYRLKISGDYCSFQKTSENTKEDFLKAVAAMYDDEIVTAKRNCENAKVLAKNTADSLVNLKFFIRNNTTGETYSNVSEQEIAGMRDGWYLVYTAGSGIISSSDKERETVNSYYRYSSLNSALDSKFGENNYDITLALPETENLQSGDAYYDLAKSCISVKNNFTHFGTAGMSLLLAAFALAVYLVMVSGRTNASDEPRLSWIDKIPTDIHFIISLCLTGLCVAAAFLPVNSVWNELSDGSYTQTSSYIMIICDAFLMAAFFAVILEWAMHVSRFYKAGKPFFKNSVIGKIVLFIIRIFKGIASDIKRAISVSPKNIKKKIFNLFALYLALNVACITAFVYTCVSSGGTLSAYFWMLIVVFINAAALSLIWKYLTALDEIAVAAEKGKNGEAPQKIDSENFPEPMKSIADNIYVTQDEMKKAVGEAIRGEKMKTELITNVSHDLKTPLTSIITYVDLLKKCDIKNDDALKYIGVLDDKSKRLKRLIDDLVEASKVSSGIVKLNIMNVNLNELTVQAIAEVEDGYEKNNLEIIYNEPQNPPTVRADSQKTWRVIDNLLSNAKKYSIPGSRVYVEVGSENGNGYFSIKNVSKQALNIDAEELTHRFVTGDSSRANEGSGLGLSIAKDLCALQGGRLKIEIDGDLFKATMELPSAPPRVSDGV